ncbi:MAG: DUF1285 domain-containing protein [Deltaproteobacteria bacterium]|nr:DUF1285 domain-containing protein [Deltaproteobacteria bacterium]
MDAEKENNIPPCNIWVDKDGVWYYRGKEMFRKEFIDLFYQNLTRDGSGRYIIEIANDRCYIEVEDVPFVVKAVYKSKAEKNDRETISILLNNSDMDELDLSTLQIRENNVLYCSVKNKTFGARFSRAGYYQLAEFIEYDEGTDSYYISLNNQIYTIRCLSS